MAAEGFQTPRNETSLATAKVIPIILAAIVAYTSYVVVGPLSVEYLINAPRGVEPRVPAGIAIPIIWFLLLLPVAATWLRLLLVVSRTPGYTALGGDDKAREPPAEFWMRDAFLCDQVGLPIFCQHCKNWKPDRAHHNQDTGRCTLKMDHFCPWVGGVVGERSLKFFIQFLIYSLILSTYLLILLAYFVHESRSNVQWLVALGIAAFFVLFTLGMVVNTMHMVFRNVTTIENIDHLSRTMLLAVLLPPELQSSMEQPSSVYSPPSRSGDSERRLTSEIDDPAHNTYFSRMDLLNPMRRLTKSEFWRGTVTYPLPNQVPSDRPPLPAPPRRTFAILETPPGMNPWDLGSPWRNFEAVFGYKLHHWLLPIRHSPCCDHSSAISFYPLGPDFELMLEDAGMVQRLPTDSSLDSTRTGRSRRKKRRLADGWQNGERPDAWYAEKAARRMRRESRRRIEERSPDGMR